RRAQGVPHRGAARGRDRRGREDRRADGEHDRRHRRRHHRHRDHLAGGHRRVGEPAHRRQRARRVDSPLHQAEGEPPHRRPHRRGGQAQGRRRHRAQPGRRARGRGPRPRPDQRPAQEREGDDLGHRRGPQGAHTEDRRRRQARARAGAAGARLGRDRPRHHHDRRRLAAEELRRAPAPDDGHPGDGRRERHRLGRARHRPGAGHDPRAAGRPDLGQLPQTLRMDGLRAAVRAAWLGLLLVAAPSALAQRAGAVPDFPLEEVRPGLTGHGLTAGPGGAVERFEVEVLAVQHDAGPGFPLVLVRASGPLIEAAGGVAAGMSGSPVYLPRGGRDALLGAVGYVFPQADHDLALVTPIGAMRDRRVAAAPGAVAVPGLGTAVPAPTRPLAPFGAQGAAGGAAADAPEPELVPGAAIAVQLMTGDLSLAALGTLTAVDGRSLLALGHPLFGTGAASYGIGHADVTAIVPSAVVPFKLANLRPGTVGAVTLDTPAALVASAGALPATIAVELTVAAAGREERFAVDVAADERLYPLLTAVATLEAADRVLRATGPGKADLAWEVSLAEIGRA